jgi:hypothetical protein
MRRLFLLPLFVLLFAVSAFAQSRSNDLPQTVTEPGKAFVNGSLVVKGEGAAPSDKSLSAAQKRILALRAAKVVALREASEIIDGVTISGDTAVSNAAAESDIVRSTVEGIIKGAQVVKEVYDPVSEMGVVFVNIPLTGPNGALALLLPKVIPVMPPTIAQAYEPPAGLAAAKDHDGLIIDARAVDFSPALINRVLTANNEVLYDPSRLPSEVITKNGAALYTNDIDKAKELLGKRGSSNPLVVTASGVVNSTDIQIGPDDAGAVFSSNQATNFLSDARVVFVLK